MIIAAIGWKIALGIIGLFVIVYLGLLFWYMGKGDRID